MAYASTVVRDKGRPASFALAIALAFGAPACHAARAPYYAPAEIDDIAADCQRRIDSGRFAKSLRGASWLGTTATSPTDRGAARVLVYGAEWCRACDAATEYLERRHISFVHRDVERDHDAERNAKSLLREAGLPDDAARLPIVAVRDTVMTGFRPCVIEGVLAQ